MEPAHRKINATGDQIGIDGIGGWCYGPAHHRHPVNQGAASLKWEMSACMSWNS